MISSTPRKSYWLFALLVLVAFALRLHRLDAVDLRGDEGYTARLWVMTPFTAEWIHMAKFEPSPVGGFLIYWLWVLGVGVSEFALRMLTVFGNLLGLAGMMTLTRYLFKRRAMAWLVGLWWCVSPFFIWHSQDARIYAVLSGLQPLVFYFFLKATTQPQNRRLWGIYILLQMVCLYLYYFEIISVVVQGCYVLALRRRDVLKSAVLSWIILGLSIVPIVVQLYYILGVSNYVPNAQTASLRAYFEEFIPNFLLGETPDFHLLFGIFIFGIVLVTLVASYRRLPKLSLLVAIWLLVPPILLYLASLNSGYFRPRYAMTSIYALLLGLALVIYRLSPHQRNLGRLSLVGVLAFLPIGWGLVENYQYFYVDPPKAPNWTGLTDYLEARTLPNDVVIIGDPDPTLEYYYNRPKDIYYIPIYDEVDNIATVHQLDERYDGFYVIAGVSTGGIERVLQAEMQPIYGDAYAGISQYRSWAVNPAEIEHPLNIQFGEIAILRGYTLLGEAQPDLPPILMLYWEPLTQTTTDMSVLVHLMGQVETPVAVFDHGVANAIISTRQWVVGALYRDPVPLVAPSGHYTIRIGLYETGTQIPVPLADVELERQYAGRYPMGELVIK